MVVMRIATTCVCTYVDVHIGHSTVSASMFWGVDVWHTHTGFSRLPFCTAGYCIAGLAMRCSVHSSIHMDSCAGCTGKLAFIINQYLFIILYCSVHACRWPCLLLWLKQPRSGASTVQGEVAVGGLRAKSNARGFFALCPRPVGVQHTSMNVSMHYVQEVPA